MNHRKRGEVPSYWWDFQWEGDKILNIIIETNDPRVENGIVGVIPYGRGSILKAEGVVKDFQEGRRQWTGTPS